MIAEELSALLGQPLNPNREENPIRCPLHDDSRASASVNLRKGVWNCQGCGEGGGILYLAQLLGGELDRSDIIVSQAQGLLEPPEDRVNFREKYESFMPIKATTPEATNYVRAKGLLYDTLTAFGIRHDGRGNLVMPYFDGDRVVALRYRGQSAKFYEPGSERTIYNLNRVRGSERVVLAEGESDAHVLSEALPDVGVGAIPGANSSVEHWELWSLDLMWADTVWIAFDADEAGDKGAERAIEVLGEKARRLRPTKGNDWSEAIAAGEKPALV